MGHFSKEYLNPSVKIQIFFFNRKLCQNYVTQISNIYFFSILHFKQCKNVNSRCLTTLSLPTDLPPQLIKTLPSATDQCELISWDMYLSKINL